MATQGCNCQIPKHVLDQAKTWDSGSRGDALCLRLARNNLTNAEMEEIAQEIFQSDKLNWMVWRALKILSNSSLTQAAEFALALLDIMVGDNSKRLVEASEQARQILNEFLTNKPSLIQMPEIWKRLNLPERI